jgi:hypothetical protein
MTVARTLEPITPDIAAALAASIRTAAWSTENPTRTLADNPHYVAGRVAMRAATGSALSIIECPSCGLVAPPLYVPALTTSDAVTVCCNRSTVTVVRRVRGVR